MQPGKELSGAAATRRSFLARVDSTEFLLAACVLIAALLLAAVERSGSAFGLAGGADAAAATAAADADPPGEDPAVDSRALEDPAVDSRALGEPALSAPALSDPEPASAGVSPGAVANAAVRLDLAAGAEAIAPELEVIGRSALSRIGYPWQWLDYDIVFAPGRDRLHALTFPYEKRIEIYIRDDDTITDLAHVIAHEIGHAIDVELSNGDLRREWLRSRGVAEDYPWWPGNGLNDFSVGAGDFAECFAQWDIGVPPLSKVAGDCTNSFPLLERIIEQ